MGAAEQTHGGGPEGWGETGTLGNQRQPEQSAGLSCPCPALSRGAGRGCEGDVSTMLAISSQGETGEAADHQELPAVSQEGSTTHITSAFCPFGVTK